MKKGMSIDQGRQGQNEAYFLTGFMGTGKTTISKALREILSCDVIDMDREIERMERMSIPEIFVQKGETWFRQCETSFLEGLKREREPLYPVAGVCLCAEKM